MDEFKDSLRLCFGLTPLGIPKTSDGCPGKTTPFDNQHALKLLKGGLILARHEDVAGKWHKLCALALAPSVVADKPVIPYISPEDRACNNQSVQLCGDISARSFWSRGVKAIFDMRITDTDAASNRHKDPQKVLSRHESEKKKLYSDACAEMHRHFTPLVHSVDGLEGRKTVAARKRLASQLPAKWK